MKTGFKVLALASLMAACSNGNNNSPVQPSPQAQLAAICANPANINNPSYSVTNPQSPCYRANAITAPGQNNPNSMDIGSFTSGGAVVIRNRQFQLIRGWGSEDVQDNCQVDVDLNQVAGPVNRPLNPGSDNLTFTFDANGLLTISMQTLAGQVRTPSPVNYQLDGQGISFPNGISLRGQPSGAYISQESRNGSGMLRLTDKQMEDQLGVTDKDVRSWALNLPSPSFTGNSGYSTNYVFGSPALANAQPVTALNNTVINNGPNQMAMDFPAFTGQVITSPTNPLHVNELYFDTMAYQGASVVATSGTNCQASSNGQLLKIEAR